VTENSNFSPSEAQGEAQIRPVILCGGSGTRLWPLSRAFHPKQLLALSPGETMLQATVRRSGGSLFGNPIVVTGEEHRFLVKEQLAAIESPPEAIILEPEGRNTAAAIALAAYYAAASDPDQLLLIMPSDHVIGDTDAFLTAVQAGIVAAREDALVTFGLRPTKAEVGYGYIESEAPDGDAIGVRWVKRFVEKPDLAQLSNSVAVAITSGIAAFSCSEREHCSTSSRVRP
jgi:mannose-1-phosphate guanylyltransferase / mannose-6-phosphate isomerase